LATQIQLSSHFFVSIMGRIALVTGACKGLGLEGCRQLGKAGYIVILTARDLTKANEQLNKFLI